MGAFLYNFRIGGKLEVSGTRIDLVFGRTIVWILSWKMMSLLELSTFSQHFFYVCKRNIDARHYFPEGTENSFWVESNSQGKGVSSHSCRGRGETLPPLEKGDTGGLWRRRGVRTARSTWKISSGSPASLSTLISSLTNPPAPLSEGGGWRRGIQGDCGGEEA